MDTRHQQTLQQLREQRFLSERERLLRIERKLIQERTQINHRLTDLRKAIMDLEAVHDQTDE